jgi:dTDP-4-amino-4,6-dideoxygalactose transaminase
MVEIYAKAKQRASDLARYGGNPLFERPFHVGTPNIGDRKMFLERMEDILDRRWLTNDGSYVRELETVIARELGVRNCIALTNGTIALELMIRAAGLTGEVIVPSFTFVATAHAVTWCGLKAVFSDIRPGTHHIDPEDVRRLITPRTSAILGVHTWGIPCDIDQLAKIAEDYGLALLFDASHAYGSSYGSRKIGNYGLCESFSFHATKFVNAFEGGAIVTNDNKLASRLRIMRNFGFAGYDNVIALGINGKMSEVSAAMALTNLEDSRRVMEINYENHAVYSKILDQIAGMHIVPTVPFESSNHQYIVGEVDETKLGVSRDLLVQILHNENILVRRYFYPGCHRMQPYVSGGGTASLPHTDQLCSRVIVFPNGELVSPIVVEQIGKIVSLVHNCSDEIHKMEEKYHDMAWECRL